VQLLEEKKDEIAQIQDKVLARLEGEKGKRKIAKSLAKKEGKFFELKRKYKTINGFAGEITSEALEELRNDPDVEMIYLDRLVHATLTESVPQINGDDMLPLQIDGVNLTGVGETVCVIDSGIDTDHAAFQGRIAAEYCYCQTLNTDGFPCCPDNTAEDTSAEDDEGHGTHCAGTAMGNHSTYMGVAPGAKVVAVKVLNASGTGSFSDITSAIDWCVTNAATYNISVISMSIGDGSEENNASNCDGFLTADAIDSAVGAGIIVFAASGNEGHTDGINYPACATNATSVGSVGDGSGGAGLDSISSFTNRDEILDMLAPGQWITAPDIGGTSTKQGTSMATPHVAGAALLLQQMSNLQSGTSLTPAQIESTLRNTGKTIGSWSRIDVLAAAQNLDALGPSVSVILGNITTANTSIEINATITDNFNNISACVLEWNLTTNFSMSLSGTGTNVNCYLNKSINGSGIIYYRISANDTNDNWGSSTKFVNITNTAPNIDSYYPVSLSINISEPQNQTFNVSYSDINNDLITVAWYLNGTAVGSDDNYTFLGNYTSAGNYNVSVVVSDGTDTNATYWELNVNNTNRPPTATNVVISCSDALNRTNGTLTGSFNYSDTDNQAQADNETAWYNNSVEVSALRNLTQVEAGNTSKNQNWIFSVRVYDGDNWSNWVNSSNLTITNSDPVLTAISNITINETELVNITANANDEDNDALTYEINDTRFTKNVNEFTWQTNLSDSGVYNVRINATDGSAVGYQDIVLTIVDALDTDGDGNPDFNDADADNDGINNTEDTLTGNISNINASIGVDLYVNGSDNTSQVFNDTLTVNITDDSNNSLVEFDWNFTAATLTINWNIDYNATAGTIRITDMDLASQGITKTVYINQSDASHNYVCIADDETTSIVSLDASCTGHTKVACTGTSGQYTCTDLGDVFKVEGLNNSAVKGIYVSPPGNRGGGGGGGTRDQCRDRKDNDGDGLIDYPYDPGCSSMYDDNETDTVEEVCYESWICDQWSKCVNGTQTRICADWNVCGTEELKPEETKECEEIKEIPEIAEEAVVEKDEEPFPEKYDSWFFTQEGKAKTLPIVATGVAVLVVLAGAGLGIYEGFIKKKAHKKKK